MGCWSCANKQQQKLLPVGHDCFLQEVDNEWASIVDRLEELASESSRYVERKERNQQRVSFRDLHHSVNVSSRPVPLHSAPWRDVAPTVVVCVQGEIELLVGD